MHKKVIIILIFVLLSTFALADDPLSFATCTSDDVCSFCEETELSCYCNLDENICYVESESTTEPQVQQATLQEPQVTKEEIDSITTLTQSTARRISSLERSYAQLQEQEKQTEEQTAILESNIDSLATGLATIQNSLVETQSELEVVSTKLTRSQKRSKALLVILLSVIIFIVALLLSIFTTRKSPKRKLHPDLTKFITEHIKQGKKYTSIRDSLLNAGYSQEDAAFAYKETMRKNYSSYKKNVSPKTDSKKVLALIGIAIILVILVMFILKGATTGQAAHFSSDLALELAVEDSLRHNFSNNAFYANLPATSICVQVVDSTSQVSYVVTKLPEGHVVFDAQAPCDSEDSYDFALKFLTYQSFEHIAEEPNCFRFTNVNSRRNNLIILPSRYILPGFIKNPEESIEAFCPALELCLTSEQSLFLGC